MAYTELNGLEQPEVGTQTDEWGYTYDRTMGRISECDDGILNLAVTGDRTIVYSNGSDDEAHYSAFNLSSGAGGALIFAEKQGQYLIRNGTIGSVTCHNAVGANTVIQSGSVAAILVHPTAGVFQVGPTGSDLKAYIDTGLATERAYADSLAFDAASTELPAQSGNSGKYMTTNGSTAFWKTIEITDVNGLTTALSDNDDRALAFSIVF